MVWQAADGPANSHFDIVYVLIKANSVGLDSNGYFRHFKSDFAAVKSEVGLLSQLIKTS